MLKWAQTNDGFIDYKRTDISEAPLIISNSITKQLTHKMRSENQAILVGANTVLLDNPSLTVRNWSGKSPIRIAIDRQGRIPENFNIKDGSIPTLIFTERPYLDAKNLEYIQVEFDGRNLNIILRKIYERNIHSVLVEGGATILNSFIEAGLWDEANIEISPVCINEGVAAPKIPVQEISCKTFENHQWLFFRKK
ncbi:MAG: RibD family protein [Paludibacter sp.]